MSSNKLSKIYYSPQGYWRGIAAIKKLASAAGVSEQVAKDWLKKQAIWQIYLPAPKYIPRPKFDVAIPNEIHQADLLFLPHDRPGRGRKLYKYALTIVDIASRYKDAEPLSSKESSEVAKAFANIYKRTLKWPKVLQVDPGREFMGKVNELMKSHNVEIRRGEKGLHRAQGIVERFNRTLAERLFGFQYAQEILLEARGQKNVRSREWVNRLPDVIKALNDESTRLTGLKPSEAIKNKSVNVLPSVPIKEKNELRLPSNVNVRYLYQDGELEGGEKRRATDPIWSLDIYKIERTVMKPGEPIVYYLFGIKRSFVRQELLVVPTDTELPPTGILSKNKLSI